MIRRLAPIRLELDGDVVSFSRCHKEWENLAPTGFESVRHCNSCERDVHLVADGSGAQHALANGRCIAIPVADALYCGGGGVVYDVGPSQPLEW